MARGNNRGSDNRPLAAGDSSPPLNVNEDGGVPDPEPTPVPPAGDLNNPSGDVHARLAHARQQIALAHRHLENRNTFLEADDLDAEASEHSQDDEDDEDDGEKITLHVLKPFKFLSQKHGERHISKGDQSFDPRDPKDAEFLAHPYITKDLADGSIEHPDVTRDRLESQAVESRRKADLHKQLLRDANESFARFQNNQALATTSNKQLDDELNTPLNQLQRR